MKAPINAFRKGVNQLNEQHKEESSLNPMRLVTGTEEVIPFSPHVKLTDEQLLNEIDYWRSTKLLKNLLQEGFISEFEFNKIDALNREAFSPVLAQLMPSNP